MNIVELLHVKSTHIILLPNQYANRSGHHIIIRTWFFRDDPGVAVVKSPKQHIFISGALREKGRHMHKVCYICQGKISLTEDYRSVKGLFIHGVTLLPNGERRYCFDEYKKQLSLELTLDSIRLAGW